MPRRDRSLRLAEQWFLANGLPAVLRPGVLLSGVWPRSAPALAAYAVVMANSILLVTLTGKRSIDIAGTPTLVEWFVLATVLLVLPAAALAGWLAARSSSWRTRGVVATVAAVVIVLGGILGGPSPRRLFNLTLELSVVALILLCTATGIGSVLGWVLRETLANLASVGYLLVRALPVVLLTVLVFFNTYVWLMAATISRQRLWVALFFLFGVAAVFLISGTMDKVRPILLPGAKKDDDAQRLVGTPFAQMPDRPRRVALSRAERLNVVFVVALSQIVQVLTVAIVTSAIFFILGLILLSPELLAAWTRSGSTDGQILGMTLPIPQALIQTSMFLAALTFMYLSARAVTDADQRRRFLDPLIDDLRLTLVARDRYRTYTAT